MILVFEKKCRLAEDSRRGRRLGACFEKSKSARYPMVLRCTGGYNGVLKNVNRVEFRYVWNRWIRRES
jgi:hypothetical protein